MYQLLHVTLKWNVWGFPNVPSVHNLPSCHPLPTNTSAVLLLIFGTDLWFSFIAHWVRSRGSVIHFNPSHSLTLLKKCLSMNALLKPWWFDGTSPAFLPLQAQKNERESIRQKLALGSFFDDGPGLYTSCSKSGKPSLSSRYVGLWGGWAGLLGGLGQGAGCLNSCWNPKKRAWSYCWVSVVNDGAWARGP